LAVGFGLVHARYIEILIETLPAANEKESQCNPRLSVRLALKWLPRLRFPGSFLWNWLLPVISAGAIHLQAVAENEERG
jgi:hypothetical protein